MYSFQLSCAFSRILFFRREEAGFFDAVNQIEEQVPDGPFIRHIIEFLRSSTTGIITKI
jgi:acyl-[acyl carrier protein]--UDP-N-acetylglucosamine O-acyltransferase